MRKAIAWRRGRPAAGDDRTGEPAVHELALAHHDRHIRRKRLVMPDGGAVLVDLASAVLLGDGDRLVLEDGTEIAIRAEAEPLFAVSGRSRLHLSELAWHLGNRHVAAQIEDRRILILRDRVIAQMVEALGGDVEEVVEPFMPLTGAYDRHAHHHAPALAEEASASGGADGTSNAKAGQ